jgi:hypothetical protein
MELRCSHSCAFCAPYDARKCKAGRKTGRKLFIIKLCDSGALPGAPTRIILGKGISYQKPVGNKTL